MGKLVFAWGGWLVAILLSGLLAFTASELYHAEQYAGVREAELNELQAYKLRIGTIHRELITKLAETAEIETP